MQNKYEFSCDFLQFFQSLSQTRTDAFQNFRTTILVLQISSDTNTAHNFEESTGLIPFRDMVLIARFIYMATIGNKVSQEKI